MCDGGKKKKGLRIFVFLMNICWACGSELAAARSSLAPSFRDQTSVLLA